IGGDRRVVAEVLVETSRIRSMVAGGDLGERGTDVSAEALCLLHEHAADAALTNAGVDNEGHDPEDPVGVLEARQRMDRDEAENLAAVVGDDDSGVLGREPPQAIDDVRWTGRIALVREQSRDAVGVCFRCEPEGDGRAIDHGGDGTVEPSQRISGGLVTAMATTTMPGPKGPSSMLLNPILTLSSGACSAVRPPAT